MPNQLNEDFVLNSLRKAFPEGPSLNNDAALVSTNSSQTVVCSDNLVEGIHYSSSDTPEFVANLLLKRVISDQSSSGATPYAITLNFVLSRSMPRAYLNALVIHLSQQCSELNIRLIGGDTSITNQNTSTFSVTCFGECVRFLQRNMAVDGQGIYITGYIGDAFLAHELKEKRLTTTSTKIRNYFKQVQQSADHRTNLMKEVCKYTDCAIDISDGLLLDAHRVGEASGCVLNLYHSDIPFSPQALSLLEQMNPDRQQKLRATMLSWGGDYEVLFTSYPSVESEIASISQQFEIPITAIGYVGKRQASAKTCVRLLDENDEDITPTKLGFQHGMDNAA